MSNSVRPDLYRFTGIIISLLPYALHQKLDYLIEKLTSNVSESVRYLIKLEIRKLAKPCEHIIDLRLFFDECEEFVHNQVSHYLDQISKALFEDSLQENNGIFTLSAYQTITASAKKRHGGAKSDTSKTDLSVKKLYNIPLVNPNIVDSIQTHFLSKTKAFIYDPLGMTFNGKNEVGVEAEVIDMNKDHAVVTMATDVITLEPDRVFLWLYQHHSDIGLSKEIIVAFKVLEVREFKSGTKGLYRLALDKDNTVPDMLKMYSLMLNKVAIAIKEERMKLTQPLCDSINSTIHERFYINRTNTIAMICSKGDQGWFPSAALRARGNDRSWSFMEDEEGVFHLPNILLNDSFQHQLNQEQEQEQEEIELYAFILKYKQGKKVHFGIIWYHDYLNTDVAKNTFNQCFLGHNYRFMKIVVKNINPLQDAHKKVAVPSELSPNIALLNMPLTTKVTEKIDTSNRLVMVTGITSVFNDIMLDSKTHKPTDIILPDLSKLPVSDHLKEVEIVTAENNDLRSENRFDETFELVITQVNKQKCHIPATTINISSKGMSVHLSQRIKIAADAEILLNIAIPFKGRMQSFSGQTYQAVGDSIQNNLRLVIRGAQQKHKTCQLIRQYAYVNRDKIHISGSKDSEIQGLNKALINIYSHHHMSLPFYITQEKRFVYIRSYSSNRNTRLNGVYEQDNLQMLEKCLLNKKFISLCVSNLRKLDKETIHQVFYIILLPREHEGEQMIWFSSLQELSDRNLFSVYQKMKTIGEPSILRVNISRAARVQSKYFIDELNYLSKLDYTKCEHLLSEMNSTKGLGEIDDVTHIVSSLLTFPQP